MTPPPSNPFYAARHQRVAQARIPSRARDGLCPVAAGRPGMPARSRTSPASTTSAAPEASMATGPTPGNCGGNLIKDLLLYFQPHLIADPMTGSGTCRDVCAELGIPCMSLDIHTGFDACDPTGFGHGHVRLHLGSPALFRQKLYADDRATSRVAPTLEAFLHRYGQFLRNCGPSAQTRWESWRLLMGDYSDRQFGVYSADWHTKRLAFAAGLRQHCTDIIRFSHGASSGKKFYRSALHPRLHDVCCIFEKTA